LERGFCVSGINPELTFAEAASRATGVCVVDFPPAGIAIAAMLIGGRFTLPWR
jgi:hypothetical protein